jgi:CRP-like cAMP-binding protein
VSIEDDIIHRARADAAMLGRTALRILAIGAEAATCIRAVLFNASDPTDCGYVIQEGSFRLESDSRSVGEVIAGPGTLLGELALLAQTKRPATATAREPSTVIRISRSLFLKMLEGYPDAAQILREQIVARAQQSIDEVADVRAMLDASEAPR